MASSVARALERIKQDLEPHLSAEVIEAACRDAGHDWRERKFGPVETVHLFVLQVLHCNTAIRHLRHLAGRAVNAAAFCKARARLPLAAMQALLRGSSASLREALGAAARGPDRDPTRWRGHRPFLVDACGTIAPTPPRSPRSSGNRRGRRRGAGCRCPRCWGCSTR